MNHYAVVGWPVAHSRSPLIHRFWLAKHKIAAHYEALAVKPPQLDDFLRRLPQEGFGGLNVTIPHKETAFRYLAENEAELSPEAQKLGAVNLVLCSKSGDIVGDNVDGAGFLDSLPDFTPVSAPVVILGAGGAAAAILAAFMAKGQKQFRLLNRTQSRAEFLAARLAAGVEGVAIACPAWQTRHTALAGASMLVNTTSLGMAGEAVLEIDLDALPLSAPVTDIVYTPWQSDLLRAASAKGHFVLNGAEMLLGQAARSFARWFGVMPDISDELRQALRRSLEAKE